jgi:hypothetical protein
MPMLKFYRTLALVAMGAVLGGVTPAVSGAQFTDSDTVVVVEDLDLATECLELEKEWVRMECLLDFGRWEGGTRLTALDLQKEFTGRIANPFEALISDADTLGLTDAQVDSIASLNRSFLLARANTWTPLTATLAELPDDYDAREALELVSDAYTTVLDSLSALGPAALGLLTADQIDLVPASVRKALEPNCIRALHPVSPKKERGC